LTMNAINWGSKADYEINRAISDRICRATRSRNPTGTEVVKDIRRQCDGWNTSIRYFRFLLWIVFLPWMDALQAHRPNQGLFPSRALVVRRMVLTTPESIIEQASTQKLLDDLIDESVRTSARRPVMMQFDPSSGWIWKRWKGTIFSETWDSCVSKMVYATIVFLICKKYPSKYTCSFVVYDESVIAKLILFFRHQNVSFGVQHSMGSTFICDYVYHYILRQPILRLVA
jgi:hypothetical protein